MHPKMQSSCIGLSHDIEKEELRQSIQDGTLDQHLQKIPVKKDDLFSWRQVQSMQLGQEHC